MVHGLKHEHLLGMRGPQMLLSRDGPKAASPPTSKIFQVAPASLLEMSEMVKAAAVASAKCQVKKRQSLAATHKKTAQKPGGRR